MLRRFLLASVGAAALAGSAFAADLPSRPAPVIAPPPPIFSWTGLYVGGSIGYAWGNDHAALSIPGTPDVFVPGVPGGEFPIPGFIIPGTPSVYHSYGANPGGVIGGAQIGYNLQLGPWVAGLEGDVSGLSLGQTKYAGFAYNDNIKSNIQGSIRLRAGYAIDRILLYATGGAGFAGINTSYASPFGYDSISRTRTGWTVGGGVEYAVTNNWTIRAEYRYSDFGAFNDYLINSSPILGTYARHHLTQNQVEVGFNYKFDSLPPAPVVAKY
ncbi:outer membrane protein [Methylocapsa palsarum]|uniref:Outer membrane immunogenic protein n=1 Tax=Methylocapsa palsarum TaxID=1612308 RepID=A0A1I3WU29_9HYPH|nr:outer membrane protein [Methylocapsa palsarum]SFK09996.1 outer membrane immunogenic protein [Methylocapsa palsarum]